MPMRMVRAKACPRITSRSGDRAARARRSDFNGSRFMSGAVPAFAQHTRGSLAACLFFSRSGRCSRRRAWHERKHSTPMRRYECCTVGAVTLGLNDLSGSPWDRRHTLAASVSCRELLLRSPAPRAATGAVFSICDRAMPGASAQAATGASFHSDRSDAHALCLA
jgi:hypothetical protein